MIPNTLNASILNLPKTINHTIVIITGCEDRHKRFALRLQQEFESLVIAWYEVDTTYSLREDLKNKKEEKSEIKKEQNKFEKLKKSIHKKGIISTIKLVRLYIKNKVLKSKNKRDERSDDSFFKEELLELETYGLLNPIKISPTDAVSLDFINEIKGLNPYFLLTLGGVLHKKELLNSIRGIAINQHAGFSPDFKGSETHLWALYHRDVLKVSSTVHITKSGADDGPIIRRSTPCFSPNDTVEDMFNKVVVLGTELMVEIVHNIFKSKELQVFNQPKYVGKTCLSKEMNRKIKGSVLRDFDNNWLKMELKRLRKF